MALSTPGHSEAGPDAGTTQGSYWMRLLASTGARRGCATPLSGSTGIRSRRSRPVVKSRVRRYGEALEFGIGGAPSDMLVDGAGQGHDEFCVDRDRQGLQVLRR